MALERRIKQLCPPDSPVIQRLRKRVALERFLARLQDPTDSPYLLKGAFAFYLRFGTRARVTQDLDLGVHPSSLDRIPSSPAGIPEDLRKAAVASLNDFFAFQILGEGEQIQQEPDVRAYRFSVRATLDDRPFESFRLDIGMATTIVEPTEEVQESDTLAFADIVPRRFRAISLVQQFAEKVHALTYPWEDRENTRVKDLVDLVLILELSPPNPYPVRAAVEVVFRDRRTHPIPAEILDLPSWWVPVYARATAESRLIHAELRDGVEFLRQYWAGVFP
jgi:hypothetical protein